MIDIHSHILPDIDDGAKNYDEALEIIKESQKQGISKMVATPHFMENDIEFSKTEITTRINKLQTKIRDSNLNVEILPGAEVAISYDLGRKIEQKEIISINNSRYILLEFPFIEIPEYVNDVIYDLRVLNFCPIISHPERYASVISDSYNLYKLIKKGQVYAQLNIGSLIGKFGTDVKKTALKLIENNLIHFIASDVHSSSHRKQYFKEGLNILNSIDEKYGKRYLNNAQKVIKDEKLEVVPPEYKHSQTFLGKIKKLFLKVNN